MNSENGKIIFLRNTNYSNRGNIRHLPYDGIHCWAVNEFDIDKFFTQAYYSGSDKKDFVEINPSGKEIYALNFKQCDDYVKGHNDTIPELEKFNQKKHVLIFDKMSGAKPMYPYHSNLYYQIIMNPKFKDSLQELRQIVREILVENNEDKYANCLASDLIRMEIIQEFIKNVQEDSEYNIEEPDSEMLLDPYEGYNSQSYIENRLEQNEVVYWEGWSSLCWEGAYAKKEYKKLTKPQIIEKIAKERFPRIAQEFNWTIKDFGYEWYETWSEGVDDGYIMWVIFQTK
jgi:hypothetical protein